MTPTRRLAAAHQIIANAITDMTRADNDLTRAAAGRLLARAAMVEVREGDGKEAAAEVGYRLGDEMVGGV